jgi:osmotically-inducible protein OsmY
MIHEQQNRALLEPESLEIVFADADVERRVRALIRWTLDPSRDSVEVRVEDGWAVLTGEVSQMRRRNDIGRHVRCLAGVRGLDNRIAVKGAEAAYTH